MKTEKLLARLVVTVIALCGLSIEAPAQTAPLPLGQVTVSPSTPVACPSGFLSGTSYGMTCYKATITSCNNTEDLGFTYGYATPSNQVLGTIVLLTGAGGQDANQESEKPNFATFYFNQNYRVVQLAWDKDWEDATNGMTGSGVPAHDIKAAACRPATFLRHVYDKIYTAGGMCAQGYSGGSGALGYALAWYGATYLDKAELLSGPVFSDIEQGCVKPAPTSPVTVCSGSPTWCQLGTPPGPPYQAPWPQSPTYSGHPMNSMKTWTGDGTCVSGDPNTGVTSATSNQKWLAMSIVDGTSNPSFSYPHTVVTGFVCATTSSSMNNSSPEGWLFFDAPISAQQVALYAVQNCPNAEAVDGTGATVPAIIDLITGQPEDGLTAIRNDMTTGLGSCLSRH